MSANVEPELTSEQKKAFIEEILKALGFELGKCTVTVQDPTEGNTPDIKFTLPRGWRSRARAKMDIFNQILSEQFNIGELPNPVNSTGILTYQFSSSSFPEIFTNEQNRTQLIDAIRAEAKRETALPKTTKTKPTLSETQESPLMTTSTADSTSTTNTQNTQKPSGVSRVGGAIAGFFTGLLVMPVVATGSSARWGATKAYERGNNAGGAPLGYVAGFFGGVGGAIAGFIKGVYETQHDMPSGAKAGWKSGFGSIGNFIKTSAINNYHWPTGESSPLNAPFEDTRIEDTRKEDSSADTAKSASSTHRSRKSISQASPPPPVLHHFHQPAKENPKNSDPPTTPPSKERPSR